MCFGGTDRHTGGVDRDRVRHKGGILTIHSGGRKRTRKDVEVRSCTGQSIVGDGGDL